MSGRASRLAVVGAGWAGLAAAVQATAAGHRVSLFEMAPQPGGRARSVLLADDMELDNGQHILIGAYTETLRLMRLVGADPERLLQRMPLELTYPDGRGLRLPAGPPRLAFAWGVLRAAGWSWRERLSLLRHAARWQRNHMRNPGVQTVDDLCAALPARVRIDLIEPLCVAALNTPSAEASATVFLRVLADALFGGRGSADLLLPRVGLSQLFPVPALRWLTEQGAACHTGHRVQRLEPSPSGGWLVDGGAFDAVILACTAVEAARLMKTIDRTWSRSARALPHEPIATVYLRRRDVALPAPMIALHSDDAAPAQFAFDLGRLGRNERIVAFVVSGARRWAERGLPALSLATLQQAARAFPAVFTGQGEELVHTTIERRATFRSTASLVRPSAKLAPALSLAADFAEGPYPATLEGAVRSGVAAAKDLA